MTNVCPPTTTSVMLVAGECELETMINKIKFAQVPMPSGYRDHCFICIEIYCMYRIYVKADSTHRFVYIILLWNL